METYDAVEVGDVEEQLDATGRHFGCFGISNIIILRRAPRSRNTLLQDIY
jgi:hypothetical protein